MLPNTPAFAVVFYGIMYRGAVAVPMNPLLKSREVFYYLSNSGAKALFAAPAFAGEATAGAAEVGAQCWLVDDAELAKLIADLPAQESPVQRDDDDVAVILHTSGTTGKPKGAMLTHGNLGRNCEVSVRTLVETTSDDVVMGCLPLFHVFGLTCGLNSSVLAGAMMTLLPRFDPRKALEVIERDAVTVFEGVPTMYSAMLSVADEVSPGATRSLRTCVSGGAALPVQVLTDFEKAFGCTVLEGYGLSESSPAAAFNHPNRPRKAGSIGTPIDGVEMRVVDLDGVEVPQGQTGEIQIRGHNVMKGYWNLPDATKATITADGWLNTGDVGKVDEDGYFYIVDRTKDMIIRGGYNVYPREIEEVLYEHPDGGRSRRHRYPARLARRGSRRRGRPQEGGRGDLRRVARLRQGPGGRLQVPAPGLARRRAAQGAHRQGAETRHHRSDNRKHPITMANSQGFYDQSRRAGCAARPAPYQRHQAIRQPNDAERHLGPLRRQPCSAPRRGGRPGRHADP